MIDPTAVLYVGHRPAIDDQPPQAYRGRLDELAVYPNALAAKRFARRQSAAKSGAITNTFPVFATVE